MMRYLILIIVFNIFYDNIPSQAIHTLQVPFTRISEVDSKKPDTVSGRAFYVTGGRILIKIEKPLLQWMKLDSNILTIYYPEENSGYRIRQSHPFSLPFFQTFLMAANHELGFEQLLFTKGNTTKSGDTSITFWEPPKELRKVYQNAVVKEYQGKFVHTSFYNNEGKPIIISDLSQHFFYRGMHFPRKLRTQNYAGTRKSSEIVIFGKLKLNKPFPKEVVDWSIPFNADINEVEW